jgi:hypothetical protein
LQRRRINREIAGCHLTLHEAPCGVTWDFSRLCFLTVCMLAVLNGSVPGEGKGLAAYPRGVPAAQRKERMTQPAFQDTLLIALDSDNILNLVTAVV